MLGNHVSHGCNFPNCSISIPYNHQPSSPASGAASSSWDPPASGCTAAVCFVRKGDLYYQPKGNWSKFHRSLPGKACEMKETWNCGSLVAHLSSLKSKDEPSSIQRKNHANPKSPQNPPSVQLQQISTHFSWISLWGNLGIRSGFSRLPH